MTGGAPLLAAAGLVAIGCLAGAVALSWRAADPRRCYDCRRPVTPGIALCAECFDRWARSEQDQA